MARRSIEKRRATVAELQTRRLFGASRKPRKRLPRQTWPAAIQRFYTRQLLDSIELVREALRPLQASLPSLVAGARESRQDADEGKRIRELLASARARNTVTDAELEALLGDIAGNVSTFQRTQLLKQVSAGLGADVLGTDAGISAVLDGFVAENVELIKSVRTTLFDDIAKAVTRGISSGTNQRDLAKELTGRLGIARRRARLIARDQVGKLLGQVNAQRQKNIGVTEFIWRTVGDERVRDEHEDRNGVKYKYSDPPAGELPGEPIQCRCTAEPVFDDILAGLT